jgi:prepilin-type processing-associated H-X9-DG protein
MKARPVLALVPLAGIFFFFLYMSKDSRTNSACQSNLKQLGLGMLHYARDYDECLMLASNWSESSLPYTRKTEIYDCPLQEFGYAYNLQVSKLSIGLVREWANKPCVFDSTLRGSNAADSGQSFPIQGAHSRSKQATAGSNMLFMDGHVKWLQQKPNFKLAKSDFETPIPPMARPTAKPTQ